MNMDEVHYSKHNFRDETNRTRYVRVDLYTGSLQFIVIDDNTGEITESYNGAIVSIEDKQGNRSENLYGAWSRYIRPRDIYKVMYATTDKDSGSLSQPVYGLNNGIMLGEHSRSDEKEFLTAMEFI